MIKNTENENSLFEAKVLGLLKKTEKYEEGVSVFLTPKEQIIASRIIAQARTDAVTFFFGGYDGSERNKLFALPEYMAPGGPLDVKSIFETCNGLIGENVSAVRVQGSGYKKLTHRDYLGSLLGLGIERDVVGDIAVLDEYSAVVFCDRKISDYLLLELKKIGNDTVRTERQELSPDFHCEKKFLPISDTVASPRFDCVVSALCGVSREKAQHAIRIGEAELDYFAEDRADRTVNEGSIISVRGYGKFFVVKLSEQTKKGRLRLLANKYI